MPLQSLSRLWFLSPRSRPSKYGSASSGHMQRQQTNENRYMLLFIGMRSEFSPLGIGEPLACHRYPFALFAKSSKFINSPVVTNSRTHCMRGRNTRASYLPQSRQTPRKTQLASVTSACESVGEWRLSTGTFRINSGRGGGGDFLGWERSAAQRKALFRGKRVGSMIGLAASMYPTWWGKQLVSIAYATIPV
jgi:hypothetical protein